MAIWFHINTRSGIPIYLQLIEQVKHALEIGLLSPGQTLPSVRELSGELSIAPNTIAKAYNELHRMGLVESRAGKGTIVAASAGEIFRTQQIDKMLERMNTLLHDARSLGLSIEEIRTHFERSLQQCFTEQSPQGDES